VERLLPLAADMAPIIIPLESAEDRAAAGKATEAATLLELRALLGRDMPGEMEIPRPISLEAAEVLHRLAITLRAVQAAQAAMVPLHRFPELPLLMQGVAEALDTHQEAPRRERAVQAAAAAARQLPGLPARQDQPIPEGAGAAEQATQAQAERAVRASSLFPPQ